MPSLGEAHRRELAAGVLGELDAELADASGDVMETDLRTRRVLEPLTTCDHLGRQQPRAPGRAGC